MSIVTETVGLTTVVPFSLWTAVPTLESQAASSAVLHDLPLPNLRRWLALARRVEMDVMPAEDALSVSLSMPHERAQARALGWSLTDGLLPWAAQAAVAQGLAQPGDGSAWGFVSLCHWQVSHGQATLTDPGDLAIDDQTDQVLRRDMQVYFAEDGLALHPYRPGQWLVQSPLLAQLPSASLDRVVGEDVDSWLVGGDHPDATARLLRRLQNEMQMLLYTHAVNQGRRVPVNSFWLHGTGQMPEMASQPRVEVHTQLRAHALLHDFEGWRQAWCALDREVLPALVEAAERGQRQRLVLCGKHQAHVYESASTGWWQRLQQRLLPSIWDDLLKEPLR